MQVNDITPERLRRLARVRPAEGKVLSVFINLDPRQFGTAPARDTQVRSVLDQAARLVREQEGLPHAAREALKADLRQVEQQLSDGFDGKGAHALAIFSSTAADLFEVLKLSRPVEHPPVISDFPYLEPLAIVGPSERWCVLLVNRRMARLFCGSSSGMEELELVEDVVHGQHKQGGWSQARYQRSVDKDVKDHLRHTADVAFELLRRDLPVGILIGAPEELAGDFEDLLHPYLRERVFGRVTLDVENTGADEVTAAAAQQIDAESRRRDDEALRALAQEIARDGRAASGLEGVLSALTEQRVDTLLVDRGFRADGVRCPRCGWLSVQGATCPADGSRTERVDDVVGEAIERALTTSAVVRILGDRPELASHGHIAALLRF
jgi:peptide chain release factor subunit 1